MYPLNVVRKRDFTMDFNQKLQHLRRQKGITQEELAQALFVSRTAVSKWESGRGYPNIDSLKAIAAYFSVTVDELLSGEQVLSIAENDTRQSKSRLQDLVFGLLDCGMIIVLFLPVFAQRAGGVVSSVSLISLHDISQYLKWLYFGIVLLLTAAGIAALALQNVTFRLWHIVKAKLSLALSMAGVLLFIAGNQPYAASLFFVFLIIKVFLVTKTR